MTLSPSAQKVQEALKALGFPHLRVVELPASTRTAEEAARAVGAEVGQIVKSLVFVGERGAYLFLVSGQNRLWVRPRPWWEAPCAGLPRRRSSPSPGPRWRT